MMRIVAGGYVRPMPGETVAGDGWLVEPCARGVIVAAADGLGHGPEAAKAASAFLDCVRACRDQPLPALFATAQDALRKTRGAVAVVARFDEHDERVEIAGVGNITPLIASFGREARLVVVPVGFVGGTLRTVRPQWLDFREGDLLLLHSDGVRPRFELAPLRSLPPAELARKVVSTYGSASDDATCLVALSERVP
jgi:negative regulator of sigma-B (phosphoserine phosphatase)